MVRFLKLNLLLENHEQSDVFSYPAPFNSLITDMSIFNEILKNSPDQVLWEEELFFCLLDLHPVTPGHVIIIPKREVESILELNGQEWQELYMAIKKTIVMLQKTDLVLTYNMVLSKNTDEKVIQYLSDAIDYISKHGFKPDAYNHGVNDGVAAGRTVNHLHWHILPRFTGDVENPIGGVRYVIPAKANYKNS